MQYQIDFGNLDVGISTAAVALITLFVSITNIRSSRLQKTAELRNQWLDDLRQHLGQFGGSVHELAVADDKADPDLLKVIAYEVTYIRLKLKKSDRTERLSKIMIDLQSVAISGRIDEFHRLFDEYMRISESILQDAWDDILFDLKHSSTK